MPTSCKTKLQLQVYQQRLRRPDRHFGPIFLHPDRFAILLAFELAAASAEGLPPYADAFLSDHRRCVGCQSLGGQRRAGRDSGQGDADAAARSRRVVVRAVQQDARGLAVGVVDRVPGIATISVVQLSDLRRPGQRQGCGVGAVERGVDRVLPPAVLTCVMGERRRCDVWGG